MSLLWGKLEQNLFFKFLKLSQALKNPKLTSGCMGIMCTFGQLMNNIVP